MSTPYYYLLGHIFLAAYAGESQLDVREALSKAGLTKDALERGRKLVEDGEHLVERRLDEAGEDRTVEHALHYAIDELEMWAQTARARLRSRLDDALLEQVFDRQLHANDHTLTSLARALRIIGMIRTHETIHSALGTGRATHDLLVRGYTLLKKVLKYTSIRLAPGASSPGDAAIYGELEAHRQAMQRWMESLEAAAAHLSGQPELLGLVGFVPDGVGLPLGGTSYAVPLHQEARAQAPDPSEARPTSGWSIGRQGRNRENLGKGFVEPTFD